MLPSLKLGRLFGIPVYLHSTLVLLPALVFFNSSGQSWPTMLLMLAATCTLFGCVLLHEFGHVLMARWFDISTRDVTLYPIGGIARLEHMAERPIEEILIALAGPAVNVLIATMLTPVVFALMLFVGGPIFTDPFNVTFGDPALIWFGKFCNLLWWFNIFLVLFNLIPAFPMDGGRVFRALLAHFFGLLRGTEIAVPIGIGVILLFACLMMGVSIMEGKFSPMPLFIAGVISMAGTMELRALRQRERDKQDAASPQPLTGSEDAPYTPLPYPDEDTAYPTPKPERPAAFALKPGFSGYTFDHEFGVWVRWQDGRRVEALWHGSE